MCRNTGAEIMAKLYSPSPKQARLLANIHAKSAVILQRDQQPTCSQVKLVGIPAPHVQVPKIVYTSLN